MLEERSITASDGLQLSHGSQILVARLEVFGVEVLLDLDHGDDIVDMELPLVGVRHGVARCGDNQAIHLVAQCTRVVGDEPGRYFHDRLMRQRQTEQALGQALIHVADGRRVPNALPLKDSAL